MPWSSPQQPSWQWSTSDSQFDPSSSAQHPPPQRDPTSQSASSSAWSSPQHPSSQVVGTGKRALPLWWSPSAAVILGSWVVVVGVVVTGRKGPEMCHRNPEPSIAIEMDPNAVKNVDVKPVRASARGTEIKYSGRSSTLRRPPG